MKNQKPLEERKSFSLTEAAQRLNMDGYSVSVHLLKQAIQDGSLKCVQIGNGGRRKTYIITYENLMK